MLIGIVGFANSGKGTFGNFLMQNYNYVSDSFAAPLKDAASDIFGWPRELLEGDTKISRHWREQKDNAWAKALGIKDFSPRKALQLLGTEGGRNVFGPSLWTTSLLERWKHAGRLDTVITDCRFPIEIKLIRDNGGMVYRVKRGPEPGWYQMMLFKNKGFADKEMLELITSMYATHSLPHESETAWIGCDYDEVIHNNGTLLELEKEITRLVEGKMQLPLDLSPKKKK